MVALTHFHIIEDWTTGLGGGLSSLSVLLILIMYYILIRPDVTVIVSSGKFSFLSVGKLSHSFAYLKFSTITKKHKM